MVISEAPRMNYWVRDLKVKWADRGRQTESEMMSYAHCKKSPGGDRVWM